MRRVIALLALAGAVLLVVAGCGGGGGGGTPLSKAEYEQQMQAIGQDLSKALDTSGGSASAAEAVTTVENAQEMLREAADKMDEMTPPEDITTEHDQLVAGVRQFADDLDGVISALEEGNLQALSSMMSLDSLQEIQTASAAITSKGYDIA
jgi:hypothetical protein